MRQQAKWLCVVAVLTAATPAAWAQSQAWRSKDEVLALTKRIDDYIAATQKEAGVVPAPPAEHGSFFRRLHLDLAGIIPTLHEVRDYIQDDDPYKLWTKTDELLRHKPIRKDNKGNDVHEWPFARHFAAVLRSHILKDRKSVV